MFEQILQQFLGSSQGRAAMQTLQQQHGMDPTTAQQTLGVAGEGAAQALQQTNGAPPGTAAGLFGGGVTANAITGALSGMLGGGGLGGALEGGVSGVVAGKVGEMLAARMGMNPQMASMIAAGIAPHLVNFIQGRMGTQNASGPGPAVPGMIPGMVPGMVPGMAQPHAPAASMQPMGGPQWASPTSKDPNAQGKFDPSQQQQQGGKDPYAQGTFDPGQPKGGKGDGSQEQWDQGTPDGGKGGYTKGAFDPSQDGDKNQVPAWKKG